MAFPTTSILDAFNRADENPLGNGTWSALSIIGGTARLKLVTNQAAGTTAGLNSNYWSAATFGPDTEVFATIPTLSGNTHDVYLRLANAGSASVNGYMVEADALGGTVTVYRIDASTPTALGAPISQTITAADSLGASIVGSTITAWYKVGAGAWTSLGTRSDATYSAAGNIGASIDGTTGRLDDFGGGTIAAGTFAHIVTTQGLVF